MSRMASVLSNIIAGYPTRTEVLRFDTLSVRLLVVDHLERYVDRESLLRDAHAAEPPYWAHHWPASRVLAKLVAARDGWAGKRVIDIGCGLGLPAVVAALKGAVVTAVDTAPEALVMTRANAELNGSTISVACCDLRRSAFNATFDFSLAADITYDPALQHALAEFLARHLSPDGMAWCAESVRTLDQGFRVACEARGLDVVESEIVETDEGRAVAVRLSEVRRRPGAAPCR
jgi:predicted nicotinamide N-methyase